LGGYKGHPDNMKYITESEIEQIALDILNEELGYTVLYGPDLADGHHKEREFGDVVKPL
jgi:hypothetical protein